MQQGKRSYRWHFHRPPPPNFSSRTLFCHDNLPVLRGVNSNSVDLIYLDPPFNKGRNFHAPIGTTAEGASFHDIWSPDEVKDEWHNQVNDRFPELYKYLDAVGDIGSQSAKYYLIYMAVRLIEMKRVLKDDTGSLYLHCDPSVSHYLKLLLDTIFGHAEFGSEISWKRTSSHNDSRTFGNVRDVILLYGNSRINTDSIRVPLDDDYVSKFYRHRDERGLYRVGDLTGPGTTSGPSGQSWKGVNPGDAGRCWSVPLKGNYAEWIEENVISGYRSIESPLARLDALDEAGMINWPKTGRGVPGIKRYMESGRGQIPSNSWDDILNVQAKSKESTGYPTQKPLALMERIIKASSNSGDLVLDPFCGCATTCVAAEKLERRWVGIDISDRAYDLVKTRLKKEVPPDLFRGEPIFRRDTPKRTDIEYKRQPTKEDKQLLYGRQDGKCKGCLTNFSIRNLEIDHIIPQSQGGGHELENLQLLCGYCNRMKGSRPMEYLMARLKAA